MAPPFFYHLEDGRAAAHDLTDFWIRKMHGSADERQERAHRAGGRWHSFKRIEKGNCS